ncbi:Uncharacterised protein [Chryseobacterium taihuense]|uniref:Uncharacterized protein n=1 Tax=Chryseobacterium taihuense TaxID=1141221 RepID=A0A4U8WAV1_9FLAO|nr:Uncharacterised protein [Chryseobacterium taihuense]
MKKFSLLYLAILLFDVIYSVLYNAFLSDLENEYLRYSFYFLHYVISTPAVFFNKLLPFYLPLPAYQLILIFLGNVFFQTLLMYSLFFRKRIKNIIS